MDRGLKVRGVLERLFPFKPPTDNPSKKGPYPQWPLQKRRRMPLDPYERPPLLPFDVFAAAATLLELSGAYHHICPQIDGPGGAGSKPHTESRHREVALRQVAVTETMIDRCRGEALAWRKDISGTTARTIAAELAERLDGMVLMQALWQQVFAIHGDDPVFQKLEADEKAPAWWGAVHQLLMIADEASVGVGFTPIGFDASLSDADNDMPWFEAFTYSAVLDQFELEERQGIGNAARPPGFSKEPVEDDIVIGTLSLSSADPDIACVVPKARTTSAGCTMRSLSHHLALLPPQGVARAAWYAPVPEQVLTDEREFNVLLVPFPFAVSPEAFEGVATRTHDNKNWGFFQVRQSWLPPPDDELSHRNFVDELHRMLLELRALRRAGNNAVSIDAIVFPELALNGRIYLELADRLKNSMPGLEIFISGVSDEADRPGNFVAVTTFRKQDGTSTGTPFSQSVIREKHHRWKLEKQQIEMYGLESALNSRFSWWEDIDLISRRIDFTTFRRRSVLAAMICEDLARVDPCQELLRSVGPNLIVALLMDAAQIPERWSARYATVLAEDPGSSVLTVTSRALIARQQAVSKLKGEEIPENNSIALWRDDHHRRLMPLQCPPEAQAVWLKLWSSPVNDTTLDGRIDRTGKTWTYAEHVALQLPDAVKRYPAVLRT